MFLKIPKIIELTPNLKRYYGILKEFIVPFINKKFF
jgi:hypothetical protein